MDFAIYWLLRVEKLSSKIGFCGPKHILLPHIRICIVNRSQLSILLIVVLVAPFFGMHSWLQLRKHAVRKQVKRELIAGIDKDELVLLKFSKTEVEEKLRWKHSKEFEFDGWMYDIVSVETTTDSIFYHVWWDNEETQLSRQLNRLTAIAFGNDQKRQEKQTHFNQYVRTLFFSKSRTWTLEERLSMTFPQNQFSGFCCWNISPPSPPPEV